MAGARQDENGLLDSGSLSIKKPAAPGEFETWVQEVTGRKLKRFGSDLLVPGARDFAVPSTTTIPPDYALNIGDTVSISLTGSVEGSVDIEIDRDGRIFLPNVGSVSLIGVRYRDLRDRIAAAIGRQYRGYDVSVSIKKLRGIRVYVTGFANNPGAYSVTSLSTLVNAVLAAGGPSAGAASGRSNSIATAPKSPTSTCIDCCARAIARSTRCSRMRMCCSFRLSASRSP